MNSWLFCLWLYSSRGMSTMLPIFMDGANTSNLLPVGYKWTIVNGKTSSRHLNTHANSIVTMMTTDTYQKASRAGCRRQSLSIKFAEYPTRHQLSHIGFTGFDLLQEYLANWLTQQLTIYLVSKMLT